MPLYEYHCPSCDLTFEVLASLSEASKKKPCPECGRRAPRIVSAFAIASSGNGHHESEAAPVAQQARDPRPPCMQYPQIPLSCHMDEPSLRRFVAHAQGRVNILARKLVKHQPTHSMHNFTKRYVIDVAINEPRARLISQRLAIQPLHRFVVSTPSFPQIEIRSEASHVRQQVFDRDCIPPPTFHLRNKPHDRVA